MSLDMVSVIIPIYNTENYLESCIRSVIEQTYQNIEIILIDDGSEDTSGIICDQFKKRDKRIKVYHKEHRGVTNGRKVGTFTSQGEFICYVDSDDYIEPNFIEQLCKAMVKYDADIVCCDYYGERNEQINNNNNKKRIFRNGFPEGVMDCSRKSRIQREMFSIDGESGHKLLPALWGKLFRRERIFDSVMDIDDVVVRNEDMAILMGTVMRSKHICFIHQALYHQRIRNNSLSTEVDEYFFSRITKLYQFIKRQFSENEHSIYMERQADVLIYKLIIEGLSHYFPFFTDVHAPIYQLQIEEILNKRIVLYGAGKVGRDYYRQLVKQKLRPVLWVDRNSNIDEGIYPVENIATVDFDVVLIGVLSKELSDEIKESLVELGIPASRLIWIKPLDWKGIFLQHAINSDVPSPVS